MSRTLIRVAGVVFVALWATPPAGAQPGVLPSAGSGATAVEGSGSADANPAPDFRLLLSWRASTIEHEINEAAAEDFRLQIIGEDHPSGNQSGNSVFAFLRRNARPGRFSYRLAGC